MGPRRVTLQDVAARAGVSKSSVSNVIRNHPHVRGVVKERVNAAIAELGYRPQAIGVNLQSGRTGVVSLAIPNFAQPYFSDIARIAVGEAAAHGWRLIVQQTDNDLEQERAIADAWNLGAADGLIFSPSSITDHEIEELRSGMALVLLGERSKLTTVDRVGIDSVEVARLATSHLIDTGRSRLVMIGHKSGGDRFVVSEREEGFHRALADAGLTEAAPVEGVEDWTRFDGMEGMRALLSHQVPFDAVFCANDLLALGAMKVLRDRGLRVPEDVAVIGVDDIEDAQFAEPSLSTVAIDREWMIRQAFGLLTGRLQDPAVPPRQLSAPLTLRVRDSTRPA